MRKATRNLIRRAVECDSSHGVVISIAGVVGVIEVVPKAWDEVEVPVVYRTQKGESGSTEHC